MFVLIFLRMISAEAANNSSAVIYISVIAAGVGTIATALGVWYTARARRKELDLQARQQDFQEHSVTFDEMEAAIPGLGELVKMWQGQAVTAWADNKELRDGQLADHIRILELEGQVAALQSQVNGLEKLLDKRDEQIKQLRQELGRRSS